MVGAVFGFLKDARYQTVAIAYWFVIIVLSFFDLDIGRRSITQTAHVNWTFILVAGLAFIAVTVIPYVQQIWEGSAVGGRMAVTSTQDSIATAIGQNTLRVQIGYLETAATDPDCSLIVLPANEYFDDDCITDTKSALGSFVQTKLKGRTADFEREVASHLIGRTITPVVVGGKPKRSYGLGTAVYLNHPLKESLNLLLVAATTQRPGEGLRGDVTALFTIAREAIAQARDSRLTDIFQPLIGAGHGGIKPTRALLAQMIAWSELLFASPGQKVAVTIVLLPKSEKRRSSVTLSQATQLLRVAVSVCQPEERK